MRPERLILIYEEVFEELGKTLPVEQCDRCGKILYYDSDVWVSDDNTQILCEKCMDEEVCNRGENYNGEDQSSSL